MRIIEYLLFTSYTMLFILSSWQFLYAYLVFFIFVLNNALVEKCVRFASQFTLHASLKQTLNAFSGFLLSKTLVFAQDS